LIRLHHLQAAARFASHRLRAVHPFEVQAVLLNACNLRCVYCRCPEIKTRLMNTEQWKGTIRGLGRLGTMRIKFQGGEPTLRSDFRELCAAAGAAGMRTAAITNGWPVAENPALLDYLHEVVVSLDSPRADVNDRLRGPGCHQRAVRALELAVERGICGYVNMVLTHDTLPDLEAMLEFCEARGLRLNAQAVGFGTEFYDDAARPLGLSADETRTTHRRLAEWKRQGRALMFSAAAYEKVLSWPDPGQPTAPSHGESACMAGKFYVHIQANGDVHPCVQHNAHFTAKNILSDGLEDALRNAQRHDCGDCWIAYLNERKNVYGLRPAALLEVMRRG
jgi:MoaA/NifB/PqqE/SkfB family radical SAM enzyme